MNQRGFSLISIIIAGILVLVLGGIAYQVTNKQNQKVLELVEEDITLPSQTPQPIPSTTNETSNPDLIGANWKIYKGQSFSIRYPSLWVENKSKKYIVMLTTSKNNFNDLDQILSTFKFLE